MDNHMFKKYDQHQQFIFPLGLQNFVPENHIARLLNDIIETIDITAIESTYSKNGCLHTIQNYSSKFYYKITCSTYEVQEILKK